MNDKLGLRSSHNDTQYLFRLYRYMNMVIRIHFVEEIILFYQLQLKLFIQVCSSGFQFDFHSHPYHNAA